MLQGRLPLHLTFALHLLGLTQVHLLCAQTPPMSLEVRALDAEAIPGKPLHLSVRALNRDGTLNGSQQGNITLRAVLPEEVTPVLSEINPVAGSIEVTNPGDQDVDVSGWELQAWTPQIFVNTGNAWIRIPPGSVMPGRSVFTWTPSSATPSSFPLLTGGRPFGTSSFPLGLVRWMNPSGQTMDQVWIGTLNPMLADMDTRGPTLRAPVSGASLLRIGSSNRGSSQEWTNSFPSIGATNRDLRLPWVPVQTRDLATIQLSQGAWIGEVFLPTLSSTRLTVQADDGAGLVGNSGTIPIRTLPQLTLTLSPSATEASEVSAGPVGEAVISIPSPLTTALTINLTLDASGEFAIPSSATLPPGATSVSVSLSNLSDGVPDGDAVVTLTASASDFSSTTATLLNRDAQPTGLTIVAPERIQENLGFSAWNGVVTLPFTATHTVSVQLAATPPLQVPPEVRIQAGARSAPFSIRSEDNLLANDPPYASVLSARTGSGASSTATVTILDDESSLFFITFPKSLREGTTTNGHVHFSVAHATDLRLVLSSESQRLVLPSVVVIPAGVVDFDFAVTAPDDASTNGTDEAGVLYSLGATEEQFTRITVLDDEILADSVSFFTGGACFLNSVPALWQASIRSRFNIVQGYNGPGTVDLGDLAKVSITLTQPIQFTNGNWSGNVMFSGEGLNVPLTLNAAGTNSNPFRVDVLQGSLLSRPILDFAGTPGSSKLLALAAPSNNLPALLMEVDASSGATNRLLVLPRRANRIALSEDGAIAWLASSTGTLQRVDVSAWRFDREVALSDISPSPRPLDLVVLPGSRDRVAVILAGSGASGTKVALLDNGILVGNTAPLGGSSFNIGLIAGRDGTEAFSHTSGSLSRYKLGADGVTVTATTTLGNSSVVSPNLYLSGNRLYHGDGAVFQADDLIQIQPAFQSDGLAIASEARKIQILLDPQSISVKVRSFDSWTPLPGHALPYRPAKGSRLVHWGTRGLAYVAETGAKLVMLESPLMEIHSPSLDLRLEPIPPIQLGNWVQGYLPASALISYVISNSGPVIAHGNTLESSLYTTQPLWVPDLAPGESTRLQLPVGASAPGILQVRTAILSASGNTSSNWVVETAIRIHGPEHAGSRELMLGAAAIAGNPSGDRLYASVSRLAGDNRDGVAILDPQSGAELSFLETSGSPGKLLTSDDGSRLYVIVGTNQLVRWNLATASKEVSLLVPNDTILDFQPLAGSPRSVVVATTSQLALYSDGDPLPLAIPAVASDSRLAYSGTNLWSYTPTALRRLAIKPNGLSTTFSGTTLPASFGYRFLVGDGKYLYASGQPLNTETMTISDNWPQAIGLTIDPSSGELLGSHYGSLYRFAQETFSILESQPVTPPGIRLFSPVLWGTDGIAVLSDHRVFLVHSPLRHRGPEVDVGVSITPPTQPLAEEPATWRISVTNRSASASGPVRLTVRAVGSPVDPITFEGVTMSARTDEFVGILPTVPPHSSAMVLLHAVPLRGGSQVEASILSTSPDPTPEDHSAISQIQASYPDGDLALITLPPQGSIKVGTPFRFGLTVSNAGPTLLRQSYLNVQTGGGGLNLTALPCEGCEVQVFDATIYTRTQTLAPGQTWTIWFDGTATLPGIYGVRALVGGWLNDQNVANDRGGMDLVTETHIAADPLARIGSSGITAAAWCSQRDQLLVIPTQDPALWMVNPDTLVPTNRIALPGQPTELAACDDGIHAWLLTMNHLAVLVNLQTASVEGSFSYDAAGGRGLAVASLPGHPETVVIAILSPDDSGRVVLQPFVNGVAQGTAVSDLPSALFWTKLLFLKNGLLVTETPYALRLYSFSPAGLELQSNLDGFAWYSSLPDDPVEMNGALLMRNGRIVKLDTQQADDTLSRYGTFVLDEVRGLILRASPYFSPSGARTFRIDGFDPASLQPRYSIDFPSPELDIRAENTRLVNMGVHGVLFLSNPGLVFRHGAGGPKAVALSARFQSVGRVELSPTDLELTLSVTNTSNWSNQGGVIDVSLPLGMTFSPDSLGAGTNQIRLPLGYFVSETNFTFKVRSEIAGDATVTATIQSEPADLSGHPVTATTTLKVLPPPVLLFPNVAVREGTSGSGSSVAVRLSRPTGHPVQVRYVVSLVTADGTDILAEVGSLFFAPGETVDTFFLVLPDSLPEWDETVRLQLSSTDATLLQSEVEMTIIDDDLPVLGATPVSVVEGNAGVTYAEVRLTLSRPTPRPVEVQYATLEGTAIGGLDFLPRSGWIHFEPGQTSSIVRVPILGDVRLEPSETFTVALLDAINALKGTDAVTVTILTDDSRPSITAISLDAPLVILSFDTAASTTYQVQFTTDLSSEVWTTLPDLITGTGKSVQFPVNLPASQRRFFRVVSQ